MLEEARFTIEDLKEVNVFYLDHDPGVAARAHADKHVVKMLLETAQLLSSVWHVLAPHRLETDIGSTDPAFPRIDQKKEHEAQLDRDSLKTFIDNQLIYQLSHRNHPSAEWARETTGNYDWLWRLGAELSAEYTFRYGRTHASSVVIYTLEFTPPELPRGEQNEPPLAMPAEYFRYDTDGNADAVPSYRAYYKEGKRHLLQYTKREPPDWLLDVAHHKADAIMRPGAPSRQSSKPSHTSRS